ncbi:DUF2510 domain-containing protein [Micromonospora sp. HM5-17]|nr:DUF2510 domain-containing protein [Micromonospora sp. HM5-17]
MGPGWYPDPTGRQPLRWFDGTRWTPQALDGWQLPVVDPLPTMDDAGSGAPSPAPAPPPAGTVPVVPGQAASPESPAVPAPAPPPRPAGRPPETPKIAAISQIWRLLVVAGAALLMVIGFLMQPWIELRFGDRRVAVSYFEFADWARANNVDVGVWCAAYAEGLAVVLAGVGLVAATLSAVATIVWGRTSGCAVPLLLAVLLALSIAGAPTWGIDDLPWTGPPGVVQGTAPMLIVASHLALMWTSGEPRSKTTTSRTRS